MTVEEIAARLAQHLWLQVVEIQEEEKNKEVIVFATPSGVAAFSVVAQKVGVGDWRIMGVRFDLQDNMKELIEVVHG